MKTRIISILLLTFFISFITSCAVDDNVENLAPSEEADLGSLIKIGGVGKVLGAPIDPNDLVDAGVNIQQFELDIEIDAFFEDIPDEVVQYELFKQYNGGEKVSLAIFDDLPYSFSATDLTELLSGFGINESDLRIGDVFNFTVQMTQQDGRVFQARPSFSTTVNCSSNLEGEYTVVTTNNTAGSTKDMGIEQIVEISPGYYKTVTTGTWDAGSIAADQGYNFQDICGIISVESQSLAQGTYSNEVFGHADGNVDGATGVITIYYTIDFSAGANEYTSVYTPR